jgi:hypothetical protein
VRESEILEVGAREPEAQVLRAEPLEDRCRRGLAKRSRPQGARGTCCGERLPTGPSGADLNSPSDIVTLAR